MIITSIEDMNYQYKSTKRPSPRRKRKIYIDESYAFPLLQADIINLELEEGMEISESIYQQILDLLVLPRAKKKALDLLKLQDRSEYELRQKLKADGYPDSIIEDTIAYINSYRYLDDDRFASNYIKSKMEYKSKKMITMELYQKGIDSDKVEELYEEIYEEVDEDPEMKLLKKQVAKMHLDLSNLAQEDKQKVMAKLYRKGFALDKIQKILSVDYEID